MSKAKKLLDKLKALVNSKFDDQTPPVPAPPAPGTPKIFSYPVDGGGTVYVDCSDDGIADIDTNDKVYSDAAATIPYPDGTYKVTGTDFGFTVAGGIVTAVQDADNAGPGIPLEDAMAKPPVPPVHTPPQPAPIPPPAPVTPKFSATPENMKTAIEKMTPEAMAAMFDAFATGSDQDRIANLEVVCKALMEYNFGWQIQEVQRKATTDQAIEVYKRDLTTAQAALAKQEAYIKKQDEKMTAMFELVEEIAGTPTADPITLTGTRKEKFEKKGKVEDRLGRFADAINKIKTAGQPA